MIEIQFEPLETDGSLVLLLRAGCAPLPVGRIRRQPSGMWESDHGHLEPSCELAALQLVLFQLEAEHAGLEAARRG